MKNKLSTINIEELNVNDRHLIYKKAKQIYLKKESPYLCICIMYACFYLSDYYLDTPINLLPFFCELNNKKPKKKWKNRIWFDINDRNKRIEILDEIIKETAQKKT